MHNSCREKCLHCIFFPSTSSFGYCCLIVPDSRHDFNLVISRVQATVRYVLTNSEANLLMTIRDSYIASIIVTLHNPKIIHLVKWK